MYLTCSPVDTLTFRNRKYFIKRDDLLHAEFNGNKARKFYWYLTNDFPRIKRVVSYGGSQSNAMLALSALAKLKNWRFTYYVKPLARHLKKYPRGNFQAAMHHGMQTVETDAFVFGEFAEDTLFIPQGGAEQAAEPGVKLLAREIVEFAETAQLPELSVFLPSGTGATALYLQKHLPYPVFTTPCAGDRLYLQNMMRQLEADESLHPSLLDTDKKYYFGKLYREFFDLWRALKHETGMEFDLLYDPKGWLAMLAHLAELGTNILYVHCGGLTGNASMLPRYERRLRNN
ncbi:MAG: 1-aminocyclopropane-1-carboxylate deaminase/D-cysteine desulfhydrase [Gammaproteobacteria bacterium]|nr:1-aminocyclopropane-1-carboxylate deaminase/D-cysteine desulfhydrase [Gammaproteobacteria bacterium]